MAKCKLDFCSCPQMHKVLKGAFGDLKVQSCTVRAEMHGLLSLSETRCTGTIIVWLSQHQFSNYLRYRFHTSDLFIITLKCVIPVEINGNICFLKCESRVDSDVYVTCISVELPLQLSIKGRLNSTRIYSALGSNCNVNLGFLHMSFGRKLLMCHTVECTFWNSLTVFVICAFC